MARTQINVSHQRDSEQGQPEVATVQPEAALATRAFLQWNSSRDVYARVSHRGQRRGSYPESTRGDGANGPGRSPRPSRRGLAEDHSQQPVC